MDGIDKVSPVTPTWKVTPTGDKKDQKQDKEQDTQKQRKDSDEQTPDDGRPHIDEYA